MQKRKSICLVVYYSTLLLLWKQTHVSKMICKCICVVILLLHFESWDFSQYSAKEKVVILQWHSNDLKVIYSTHIFPRVYLQGFQFFPWDTYKLNVDEKRAFDSTFDELSTLVKYLYECLVKAEKLPLAEWETVDSF